MMRINTALLLALASYALAGNIGGILRSIRIQRDEVSQPNIAMTGMFEQLPAEQKCILLNELKFSSIDEVVTAARLSDDYENASKLSKRRLHSIPQVSTPI